MNNRIGSLMACAAMSCVPTASRAQDIPAADVSVVSVRSSLIASNYFCRVVVHSENDDNALDTKVTVLLPLSVAVVGILRSGCMASGPLNGFNGSVRCDLGELAVGQSVRLSIRTTLPPAASARKNCAAFVTSDTPDGDRGNNYGQSLEP